MNNNLEVSGELIDTAAQKLDQALQGVESTEVTHAARSFLMATMVTTDGTCHDWLQFAQTEYQAATGKDFQISATNNAQFRRLQRIVFGSCVTKISPKEELLIIESAIANDGRVQFKT